MKKILALMFVSAILFSACSKSDKGNNKTSYSEPILRIDVNGIKFNMILVEGGSFDMGATAEQELTSNMEAYGRETPVHNVTLDSYYIGEAEVTQELWVAMMGGNPSYFKSNLNNPVDNAGWVEAKNFISKLNEATGMKFRFPTEAEWEFAARGGNKSKGYKYSGSNDFLKIAWLRDNSSEVTHPVKTKMPNELGLYDMSGNVFEWCSDVQGRYPTSMPQKNPTGPKDYGSSGQYHVFRGGDCYTTAWFCRVSYREINSNPSLKAYYTGLRLAL